MEAQRILGQWLASAFELRISESYEDLQLLINAEIAKLNLIIEMAKKEHAEKLTVTHKYRNRGYQSTQEMAKKEHAEKEGRG